MPNYKLVPPHEAGARIRQLTKRLVERIQYPEKYEPHHDLLYHEMLVVRQMDIVKIMGELRQAIPRRRVVELRDLLKRLETLEVRHHKNWAEMERESVRTARIDAVRNSRVGNGDTLSSTVNQIWDLAQNLPTVPDLPSTDSRDTALRSIIAILRTHSFPGSEDLTHQAKEDTSAKEEAKSAAVEKAAQAFVSAQTGG